MLRYYYYQSQYQLNLFTIFFFTVTCTVTGVAASPVASVYTTVKTREHDTIFLPCYAGNLGLSNVQWWHDDQLITDGGRLFIKDYYRLHSNNTLEVMDVKDTLSGAYICQIKRPSPMAPIKHNYIIQVLYPPKVWMSPNVEEVEVELHQDVTIFCNATGFPQPFITWLFKDEEIVEMSNQNTLSMIVMKEMSGEYSCTASNGVGTSDVRSIMVSAVYPPSINADKLWVHTAPGLRTVIECNVEGNPPPKVEWYMNNRLMTKDSRITYFKKGNRYGLIIKSSRLTDVGHYVCVAANKLGKYQLPIEVSALANMAHFKPQHVKYEDRVTLVWEVESYSPIIQYHLLFRHLYKNDKPENWTKLTIPAERSSGAPIHTQSYTIKGLNRASLYEASIISKNVFGLSKPSSLYRFSTAGIEERIDSFTTEEITESNTITDFLSDYTILTDYENEILEPRISIGITISRGSWSICILLLFYVGINLLP